MNIRKFLLLLIVNTILLSCSSDKEDIIIQTKYLKSYTTQDQKKSYRNEYFEYNDEFLTNYQNSSGFHTYEYNNDGKLVSLEIDYQNNGLFDGNYSFSYDEQNRLVKRVNNIADSYFELIYENDKVTITEYQSGRKTMNVFEHYVDENGRIVKIINPNNQVGYRIYEYTYDKKGNITKEVSKDYVAYEDREIQYVYEETINPFFTSYRKLYESIYHLRNLNSIGVYTIYGTTPNVIKRNEYVYSKDESNYPVKLIINNGNYQSIWEYSY